MSKYRLNIDLDGGHPIEDEGPWRDVSHIEAWGDGLDDCLDNGRVFYTDQDGGEAGESPIETDWAIETVRAAFIERYGAPSERYTVHITIFKADGSKRDITVFDVEATDACAASDLLKSRYERMFAGSKIRTWSEPWTFEAQCLAEYSKPSRTWTGD
jgi:hypothetical protein